MNTFAPERPDRRGVIATCVLVFIASTWVTILWCGAACDMPGMGAWDLMPDQDRYGHWLAFQGMWLVMMIAMMMPVIAPVLLQVSGKWTFAAAYFGVWAASGLVAYPLGLWLARLPVIGGLLVVAAGAVQFTRGKQRLLACCLQPARGGWRGGLRTGWHCVRCCAGLTVSLLVVGVMDLTAMALVTVAIAAERLLPVSARVAPTIGVILVVDGFVLCVDAWNPA